MLAHRTRRHRIRVMFALLGIALGGNAFAAAVIDLSRTSVDSGRIKKNLSAPAQPIFLTNTGDAPLTIQALAVDGANASDFAISGTCADGLILGPNARCRIDIVMTPTSTDPEVRDATLTIVTNAPAPAPVVHLIGTASTDAKAVVPTPLYFDFDSQAVGTSSPGQTVSIANANSFGLTVTDVQLVGANAADFTFDTNCPAHSLLTGSKCKATVVFTPTAGGPRSALLRYGLTAFGIDGRFEISVTGIATGSAGTANYQALWWKPTESGWGINLTHQGNVIFATWFTFGADNAPQWFTMVARNTPAEPNVYSSPISSFSGPPFNTEPFPPSANVRTQVGTGKLTFAPDGKSATFEYTVNGISQVKQIVPQELFPGQGLLPTCVFGTALADLPAATNYQSLWWATHGSDLGGDESGWGINFTHHGNVIFATWFTYDVNGKGWWLVSVASLTAVPGVYAGNVRTVAGPAFSAEPWDPNAVARTTVGTTTLTFTDGNHATFAYTVNGVAQSKALVRQLFDSANGTVCH